jgi:hypothetical protein
MEQLLNILLGAFVASIVPIYTLFLSSKQWKLERKIDDLKSKRERLEKIYAECLSHFGQGLEVDSYHSDFISSLRVYGSDSAKEIFENFMAADQKDDFTKKSAYLDIAIAAKEHLAAIDAQLDRLLS